MKREIKILLGILIPIIIIVITYVILMLNGIVPNPFLDTKDLVCSRLSSSTEFNTEEEIVTIHFDKKAIIKEVKTEYVMDFTTEQLAKEYYDKTIKYVDSAEINLNGKIVSFPTIIKIDESNTNYNKTKKEIEKLYEEVLVYDCE